MSELWEKELDTTEYDCCDECGDAIYNGEGYYDIDGRKICETCMDGYHRIMDYDDYTYQDYLTEKYESRRHDVLTIQFAPHFHTIKRYFYCHFDNVE